MSIPLDFVNSQRLSMHVNNDVIDIEAGCETLIFISIGSAHLSVASGDTSGGTAASDPPMVADNAGGAAGLLILQVIRPGRRFYKITTDGGTKVIVMQLDNRNDLVPGDTLIGFDASIINQVSFNSPDFGAKALRPDGYPVQAPI